MKKREILHIDVNSAFLSWEAVNRLKSGDSLDIRTIPSVIGGDPKSRRGIVLAKSDSAKKYGIQTGESLYSAFKKCPNLMVVSPNFDIYMDSSRNFIDMLKEYTPDIRRFSIDECFLDITNMTSYRYSNSETLAHTIRERIKRELGFTVSIGLSTNKLLAKVASDLKKPDAVTTLFPEEISKKMWPLPVNQLFMVGGSTSKKLNNMGIYKIGELASIDKNFLKSKFGKHGILIWEYANGIDNSQVIDHNSNKVKGIGNSSTISYDITHRSDAIRYLLSLTEMVSARLRCQQKYCTLVSVSIKSADFTNYSHQRKLMYSTDSTETIFKEVTNLFDVAWKGEPIRHLGVRVSGFVETTSQQLSFFSPRKEDKLEALDKTMDEIRLKFGKSSVIRASLLNSKGI